MSQLGLGDAADVLGIASFVLLIGGYALFYYENKYKAYKDFRNRLFKDHINFSLNSVDPSDDNHLRMRTLVETKADHVFASKVLIDKINDACARTTVQQSKFNAQDLNVCFFNGMRPNSLSCSCQVSSSWVTKETKNTCSERR